MKIFGVIPARGGSKGVPGKNIRPILGKPLIAYTIQTALQSKLLTEVVVTTEDEEIRQIALAYGAQAPFLRPAELATDKALAVPTIQHAVREMESLKGVRCDYVVMLQPTSPLKTSEDIDTALTRLIETGADGIISVVDVDNNHPMKMKKFLGEGGKQGQLIDYEKPPFENCPRQLLPPVFIVNGAIYASRRDVLMNENSFQGKYCLGYVMPPERSINIDTPYDFLIAELEIQKLFNEAITNR
jgi:CMP-N-acetylneuraminic acid synthetase